MLTGAVESGESLIKHLHDPLLLFQRWQRDIFCPDVLKVVTSISF